MSWWSGLRSGPRRMLAGMVGVVAVTGMVLVALVAGGASAGPSLPPVTPANLIASTLRALAQNPPVAGALTANVELGLPSLPDEGPQAADGLGRLLSSISGQHRVRLWSSADGLRVAELLPGAEVSFTLSRGSRSTDAWAWDSHTFTAYHGGPFPGTKGLEPQRSVFDLVDPEALAAQALRAIDPSTGVAVSATDRVAGRDVYVLSLVPRTRETLVGRIAVAVDAATHVPLRVEIFARGASSPALSVGFESVNFDPIDPAAFRFTPPPGAAVRGLPTFMGGHQRSRPPVEPGDLGEYVKVFGQGWATVVAYRIPRPERAPGPSLGLGSLLPYSGPLFSVTMVDRADHAWFLVGAVPAARLTAVQGSLP